MPDHYKEKNPKKKEMKKKESKSRKAEKENKAVVIKAMREKKKPKEIIKKNRLVL